MHLLAGNTLAGFCFEKEHKMATKDNVLKTLISSSDKYINGEELAKTLGISRAAVWKAVKSLQKEGYTIDAVTNKGYRLTDDNDILNAELVKSKFMKLNSSHVEFVLDCMRENTTKIRNIKQYLKAVLFNAPSTIDSYYTALVNHDFYGSK